MASGAMDCKGAENYTCWLNYLLLKTSVGKMLCGGTCLLERQQRQENVVSLEIKWKGTLRTSTATLRLKDRWVGMNWFSEIFWADWEYCSPT